jgi:drug/metabolite transporter (DMT)-like permease
MITTLTNNAKAALLIMLGMTLLSSNDAIMKLSSETLGIGQMLFIRGLIAVAIFSLALRINGKPIIADVVISKWIVVRALCECGGTICFITGLSLLPIATASTLVWTSPIFLTIAAALILRERVTAARWWAVLVGFTGVVLVTNPGSADFSLAMLLPLATALFICFRDMVTRKIDPSHHSLYVTWTTLVTVTAAGLLISFLDWRPIAVTQIVWLGASAILMSLAFFIQITAVRLGELSFIAPFAYSGILIAVFYGAVVWGELPGVPTIIGIVLIVLSGLFILSHQTRSPTKGAPAVSD